MFPVIEFRERHTGKVLTGGPLYEFLRLTHSMQTDDTFLTFAELRIFLDNKELLPSDGGHA
jgi:hypothetical protein